MKKTSKRIIGLILCMVLAVSLLVSCGKSDGGTPADSSNANASPDASASTDANSSPGTSTAPGAAPGGAAPGAPSGQATIERITYGVTPNLGNFFLGGAVNKPGCLALYNTIINVDPLTKETKSEVLEDWYWEDDLTLIMVLKDNVYFNNGTKATAEDIIYSYQFHFDTASPEFMDANLIMDQCIARDERTAQMKFSETNASFLYNENLLMSKDWSLAVGYESEDWYYPVTTGRYEVTEYVQESYFLLTARDDYWNIAEEGEPYVKEYYCQVYPDPTVMYMDLELGNLDMCYIDSTSYSRFLKEGGDGFDTMLLSTGAASYFVFGWLNVPEWYDIRVREAMAYGVDWEEVGRAAWGDLYAPTNSVVPTTSPYYFDPGRREFNPARAVELLAEAGYGPGDLKLNMLLMNNPTYRNLAETFQYYCSEIGVEVNVTYADPATAIPTWIAPDDDTACGFFFEFFGVPSSSVYRNIQMTLNDSGIRFYHAADPGYLELAKNLNVSDEAVRSKADHDMQQYIYDNVIFIPISNMQAVLAYKNSIYSEGQLRQYVLDGSSLHLGKLGMPGAWK